MFGLFKKDPSKKLKKQHARIQEQAMMAQRNGNIRKYSELSAEADQLWQKIEQLEQR